MTMEAIALKAGVSKETLYRWWSSKGSVLLDALAQRGEEEIPIPEGASFHEELGEFMRATARTLDRPTRQALRNLAAEAAKDANFAKEMRMRFLNRRRAALQGILNRAVDRAELNPKRVELVLDLVFGSLWYRLIFGIAPLDRRWADEVTATISGCDVKHT